MQSKQKISGIYKITSPSGKIYIGQSVDIRNRIKQHIKYCQNIILKRSFVKYGVTAHLFETLRICSVNELNKWEQFFQLFYLNCGYELGKDLMNFYVQGSDEKTGFSSDISKNKISISKKGTQTGINNPNYGNRWSDEQKLNLSTKKKGVHSGKNNPMYGKERNDVKERNSKPKNWVTNGEIDKLILKEELDHYLSNGFIIGRSKSNNLNVKIEQGECPHCGKIGALNGLRRYHFDNCKFKKEI